tara:strand:+ start:110 stop:1192 length:1083 start_codon:yes stop_codon:yes gene_type:complete
LNKIRKEIIFFIPNLIDDGIKKTLENYSDHFYKNFNITILTNSNIKINTKHKTKVINPKLYLISRIKILNVLLCLYLTIKNLNNNTIVFSLDDHYFLLLLKKFKFKFKLVIRTSNPINNPKNLEESKFANNKGMIKTNELELFKFADYVITYSNVNKNILKNMFKVKRVDVIYNYFKKNYIRRTTKKIYNIFFIGRFIESKDPVFFLKNALELVKKNNIKIYMVGKGELKKSINKIASRFKQNVHIHGFTKNPFKKFKNIDVICITSKFDGTPNVLGEAVSYNIPCLAPKNVGLSNLLLQNGRAGFLYKSRNSNDFRKKLSNIINFYGKALSKSKIAFRGLNKFSQENTVDKLAKILMKV